MKVVQASPELSRAVCEVIVEDMTRELLNREVDLTDKTAATVALAQAGFGVDSIRALRKRALITARLMEEIKRKAH